MRWIPVAMLAGLILSGAAAAETLSPVGEALARPALPVRDVERSVVLGAQQVGERIVAVGERGIVIRSDDRGASWQQVPVPTSVTLTAVRFADREHGFIVGHGGTVLSTEDGGASWHRRLDGRRIAQIELEAARASGQPAALRSAERLQADGPDKPLLDLLVLDARRLRVVGAYGIALASDDAGATWHSWRPRLDNPKELHLYALRRQGDRILIAGEQGLVLQSLDAGHTFARLTTPYAGSFFTAELLSGRGILLAGLRGNAWRSDDAGATWTSVAVPVPAALTGSALLPDGSVLLASQAGLLLRAGPDGVHPLNRVPLPPLNGVLPLAGQSVLALSMQGVHLQSASEKGRQ